MDRPPNRAGVVWKAACNVFACLLILSWMMPLAGSIHCRAAERGAAPADTDTGYKDLAAYWAPVVMQDLRLGERIYRDDYITRFDFDGDWLARNNMGNIMGREQAAWVYYWVAEYPSHQVIGYAFYHTAYRPADEAGKDQGETPVSENDLVGVLLLIEKPDSGTSPMGRFVCGAVWSGDGFEPFAERDTHMGDPEIRAVWGKHVGSPPELGAKTDAGAIGDVNFVLDDRGFHPVIHVAAGHHRVSPVSHSPEKAAAAKKHSPVIFAQNPLLDWRATGTDGAGRRTPHSARYRGLLQDGVIYRYEGHAHVAVPPSAAGKGRFPHHWEIIGYDLVSARDLWERRGDAFSDRLTFESDGVFAGSGPRAGACRAPWVWEAESGTETKADAMRAPGRIFAGFMGVPETLAEDPVGDSFRPSRPPTP